MSVKLISIGIGIILVVSVFFILGLDKVIIKPLVIKDYAISNMDKVQSKSADHALNIFKFGTIEK